MSAAQTSANVLIVDDSQICRELVRKAVCESGMTTVEAVDGFDGFAQLGKHHFDAIVLDNEMPKMNGVAFLKAMRSDKRWTNIPVLMLTTTVSKPMILEAAKYGLSGYLLKAQLAVPDLLIRLQQAITKASPEIAVSKPKQSVLDQLCVPNLVPREATLEAISKISEAKTLGGIVSQLTDLARSPKVSVAEIAGIVRLDPLLTAQIIQRAAAAGGSKARVGSIEDAIRSVGPEEVGKMASSTAVFSGFSPKSADGIPLLRCWQHALAVAAIMSRIVHKTDSIPQGLPYMIGLCHDLGEILLRQRFPDEFSAMVDYAEQAKVQPTDVIKHVFGLPYSELMEGLFDRLKLPANLAMPTKEFHFVAMNHGQDQAGSLAGTLTIANSLARALSIANMLANSMFCAASSQCPIAPLSEIDCRTALISTAAINLPEIHSESVTSACMLANVKAEVEKALMDPLLPRTEINVWYVRHRSFAELDPIESALETLTNVEVHDRVPLGDELLRADRIVVASSGPVSIPNEATRTHPQTKHPVPVLLLNRDAADGEISQGIQSCRYPLSMHTLARFLSEQK